METSSFSGYSHSGTVSSSLVSALHFSHSTNLGFDGQHFAVQTRADTGQISRLHLLGEVDIELAGAEEAQLFAECVSACLSHHFSSFFFFSISPTRIEHHIAYQRKGVEALGVALRLQHQTKLGDLGLLLGSQMAGVALLRVGRGGRVVIVVVLGFELHVGGCCGVVEVGR